MKSLIFLLGIATSIFLVLNGNFNKIATKYFQVIEPEKVSKLGKDYSVSFGFAPIIKSTPIEKKPEEVASSILTDINTSILITRSNSLVLGFKYRKTDSKFSDKEVESVFHEVEDSWGACGVKIKYLGASDKANPYYSGKSIHSMDNDADGNFRTLYWVNEKAIFGQAQSVSASPSVADAKPYISSFSMKLSSTIDSRERLKATIIHEFGHVIGLNHSSDSTSVMYYAGGDHKQNITPNKFDIQECNTVLSQIDLKTTNDILGVK